MTLVELQKQESQFKIVEKFAEESINKLHETSIYLSGQFENLQHDGCQNAHDVANEADTYIATEWVKFMTQKFPSFNIDTEEAVGKVNIGSQYTVRIDSIDGSKHFRSGIPIFSSNISLSYENQTLFGACAHPIFHEIYHASKGQGAYRNDHRISVSSVSSLQQGFVVLEGPTSKLAQTNLDTFQTMLIAQDALKKTCFRARDFGLAAFGICLVASGACVGYVDLSGTTKIYDIEAALFILKEAGGTYSNFKKPNFSNNEIQSNSDLSNYVIIASNGFVHQELQNTLSPMLDQVVKQI